MSYFVFLASAIAATPGGDPLAEQVDLIEINHFHDDQGRPVFDQIIYYDWHVAQGRYHVRDWRALKSDSQVPVFDHRTGQYVSRWFDFRQNDVLREVRAANLRETWTVYDPEMIEREYLADNKRKLLRKPVVKQPVGNPPATTELAAQSASGVRVSVNDRDSAAVTRR